MSPHNISVSVSCPPDTNTPGFEAENVGKPEETRLISEYGGLFSAEAQWITFEFSGRFLNQGFFYDDFTLMQPLRQVFLVLKSSFCLLISNFPVLNQNLTILK